MAKLKAATSEPDHGYFGFVCPGCGGHHMIPTKGDKAWGFNGNIDRPTFTPSLLVRSGHYAYDLRDFYNGACEQNNCWCTYNKEKEAKGEEPAPFTCHVCHSFITDGKIQFLGDCTHKLAGQTVELPEIE